MSYSIMDNHAINIIANLAGLPDFLRKPMLRSRMASFADLSQVEQVEVIENALKASPAVPFDVFSKLFKTWLHVLAEMEHASRRVILEAYAHHVASRPHNAISLHMDGLVEVFAGLDSARRSILVTEIRSIFLSMNPEPRRRLLLLMPSSFRDELGI